MNDRWTQWHVAIPLALALASGLVLVPATLASTPQRMHQMGTQPLDQLTGDAFDQAFLAHMSMHHAMGVKMTQPVVASGAHQELKDLGSQMMADQAREIGQMSEWLTAWYGVDAPWATAMPHPMMPGVMPGHGPAMPGPMHPGGTMPASGMPMAGHGPMTPVGPMGSMPMMPNAQVQSPEELDAAYMTRMIVHHQQAIDMAGLADGRAAHQEVKDLAASIITTQSAEIATMQSWLADWYGL